MIPLTPYLFFNGNCQQAMSFYQRCFGGQLECKTYGDVPENSSIGPDFPEADKDSIMHAHLQSGNLTLMAADWSEAKAGNHVRLCVNCGSREEIEKIFKSLGEQGRVDLPLQDAFWGDYFGMLTDQFGTQWMLSYRNI